MKNVLKLLIALLAIGIAGASIVLFLFPYEPTKPPLADEQGWSEEGVIEVVKANNRFAIDLYRKLEEENKDKNIFFSPYSVSSAFAIAYEGAREETAKSIASVFYFPSYEVLRPNFARIYNEINKGYKDYELRTGNAIWVQKDYPILEEYRSNVERYYGAKAANLDFINEAEKSRETINAFIEEQTNKKIKDLIPSGALSEMTRLVITNAIYFKGNWLYEFDPQKTSEMEFRINDKKTVKVPMMYMKPDKAEFNYLEDDKVEILELPYKGERISMLIILPKNKIDFDLRTGNEIVYNYTLDDIEITYENIEKWRSRLEPKKLGAIYLPKFEFETKYFMKDTLKDMGIGNAFCGSDDYVDLSGIDGTKTLCIDAVIHQAYVKVDEKGTEAAAATAIGVIGTALTEEIIFKVDHPFIFIIQERNRGNILFIGKVVDPTEK